MIDSFTGKNFFLSNFYPHPVTFEGITYPSSEHAYQACKTDEERRKKEIAALASAYEAKLYRKRAKNLHIP